MTAWSSILIEQRLETRAKHDHASVLAMHQNDEIEQIVSSARLDDLDALAALTQDASIAELL